MNREIKFRAWDKLDKKMYYHVGISLSGVQIYEDDATFPEKLILDRGKDCFELMLWTGLYDKHNNPIYEGDIVRCASWGQHLGVINFGEGNYLSNHSYESNWHGWFIDGIAMEFYEGNSNEFEILGNIYEHPELLKQ